MVSREAISYPSSLASMSRLVSVTGAELMHGVCMLGRTYERIAMATLYQTSRARAPIKSYVPQCVCVAGG